VIGFCENCELGESQGNLMERVVWDKRWKITWKSTRRQEQLVDRENCIQNFSSKTQREEATWEGQRHVEGYYENWLF